MTKRKSIRRYRLKLVLYRDQNGKCFFCHLRMHDDVTLEHLKAQSHGGADSLKNCRVAHARCNVMVGRLPVEEKMRLSDIGREQGSDAFFMEMKRLHGKEARKNVKKSFSLSGKKRRVVTSFKGDPVHAAQLDDAVKARIARREAMLQRAAWPAGATQRQGHSRAPVDASQKQVGAG